MKGIIFAGGNGTRLYPITKIYSKQLINVYDKPAIYYPVSLLIEAGIKEILIITDKENNKLFKKILSNGKTLGINIKYKIQKKANGCASGLKLCKSFIKDKPFCVLMGDNFIFGNEVISEIKNINDSFRGAKLFCYKVDNPKEYGIVSIEKNKIIEIEEKPINPKSNLAIMGIYIFDNNVFKYLKNIHYSERKELEIPDINKLYLKDNYLDYKIISNKEVWIDIGTSEKLFIASSFIKEYQEDNKKYIACLEEIAYKHEYISFKELQIIGSKLKNSEYGKYILSIKE